MVADEDEHYCKMEMMNVPFARWLGKVREICVW